MINGPSKLSLSAKISKMSIFKNSMMIYGEGYTKI